MCSNENYLFNIYIVCNMYNNNLYNVQFIRKCTYRALYFFYTRTYTYTNIYIFFLLFTICVSIFSFIGLITLIYEICILQIISAFSFFNANDYEFTDILSIFMFSVLAFSNFSSISDFVSILNTTFRCHCTYILHVSIVNFK